MKNLLYFSLVVLLLGVGGCKKDKCNGVVCQNGGHCENGVCVCANNYNGLNCEIFDPFTGNYHMVGYSQGWRAGDTTYYPPIPHDEIITITGNGEGTLRIYNEDLLSHTSSYLYEFMTPPPISLSSPFSTLTFHKPFIDDSAFYSSSCCAHFGGTITNLRGIKIH